MMVNVHDVPPEEHRLLLHKALDWASMHLPVALLTGSSIVWAYTPIKVAVTIWLRMTSLGGVMSKWILLAIFSVAGARTALSQPAPKVYPAELALPFGTATGKIVPSGDYLIFVADPNIENSFVIPRDRVQNVTMDGGVMSVSLSRPIRVQSGEQSKLPFRFPNGGDADAVMGLLRTASADRSPGTVPSTASGAATEGQLFSYQVKHNHRIGSCSGRLVVTSDRVIYESLTEINDSRQWAMKDIKEVEHKSSYKLDIKPFTGNDFAFEFIGNTMDSADFTTLTKLIVAARTSR